MSTDLYSLRSNVSQKYSSINQMTKTTTIITTTTTISATTTIILAAIVATTKVISNQNLYISFSCIIPLPHPTSDSLPPLPPLLPSLPQRISLDIEGRFEIFNPVPSGKKKSKF